MKRQLLKFEWDFEYLGITSGMQMPETEFYIWELYFNLL